MKNNISNKLDSIIKDPKCTLDYSKDYELLIAVMLSAQSTDKRVNIVTKELFKYSLEELRDMELTKLENIIKPVGTYHKKAIFIKNIADSLIKDYNGVVPNNRKYLESLNWIGHKSTNVVLSELFKEPAIAVDTHVSRVSKRLGLAKEKDNVLEIEKKLEKSFDKEKWGKTHLQLVSFGRNICKAKKPECKNCPFNSEECKKPLN